MASVPGTRTFDILVDQETNVYNDLLGSKDTLPDFEDGFVGEFGGSGTADNNLPVSMAPASHAGTLAPSFGTRFFERIHYIPNRLELGDIGTDLEIPLEVWNSYRTIEQLLTSITLSVTSGSALVDTYGTPLTYTALQSRIYIITVESEGALDVLNGLVTEWDGIDSPDLPVTGNRLFIFAFEPNWTDGIEDSTVYLTDIFVAESGLEQRVRARLRPRRKVAFRVTALSALEQQALESTLAGWLGNPYGVPLWQNAVYLAAPVSAGASILVVSHTTNREFADGSLVLLFRDFLNWEVVKLATSGAAPTDTSLLLSETTLNAWGMGVTKVIPVRKGFLPGQASLPRPNIELGDMDLEFLLEPL